MGQLANRATPGCSPRRPRQGHGRGLPRPAQLRRLFERAAAAGLLCAAVLAQPADAMAQSGRWRASPPSSTAPTAAAMREARERNAKAVKLYQEEGAIEAALAEMERAYDLAPTYKVLYNLGQIARTGRDYALALHAFERYLADGGDEVPTDRRRAVQEEIRELRTYVSTVTIEVDGLGAELFVNDVSIGVSPLADPVVINAGRVQLRASKGGRQVSKSVVVAGGDELRVRLALDAAATGPAEAVQPTESAAGAETGESDASPFSPYLWIGWCAAGLMGVGAAVTGGLALGEASALSDASYAGSSPPQEVTDRQDKAQTLALTTDVLLGAAAATFVVTTALAIAGVGADSEPPGAERAGRWSVEPLRAASALDLASPPWGLGLGRTF